METALETFFSWPSDATEPWLLEGSRQVSIVAAQRITRHLARKLLEEVSPGQLVASLIHAGIDASVLLLAANLAGVPITFLDRSQPETQLAEVLPAEDCKLMIAHPNDSSLAQRIAGDRFSVLILPSEAFSDPGPESDAQLEPIQLPDPNKPAYVVYSSGTTGRPKGVIRTVTTMTGTGLNQVTRHSTTPDDVLGELSSYRFVTASGTFYSAILSRARVAFHSLDADGVKTIAPWANDVGVTILRTQAAVMRTLLEVKTDLTDSRVRLYAVSGETVFGADIERLRNLLPKFCEIQVVYGSSEAGGMGIARFKRGESIPGGRVRFPLQSNTLILDEELAPVADGTVGEIVSLNARSFGYWHRESLTDERYVKRPDGTRLYRTGDLGRVSDNMLEVLGRSDSQVKVSGFNVELSEVEAEILGHPEIFATAVIDVARPGGGTSLVAVYVPTTDRLPSVASIRRHLAERLPVYKIPTRFVLLDRIPETASGKFDRAALRSVTAFDEDRPLREPCNPVQDELHRKMSDLLALKKLSIDDDFFEVGGDSLSAIEFGLWIENRFAIPTGAAAIVAHPTIELLGEYVEGGSVQLPKGTTAAMLRACADPVATLLLVAGGGDSIVSQLPLANALQSALTIVGMQGHGLDDNLPTERTIQRYAKRAIRECLKLAPAGPYIVGGHSFGGTVAQEMAVQMEAAGLRISAVLLVDTAAPKIRESLGLLRTVNRKRIAWIEDSRSKRGAQQLVDKPREHLRARHVWVFERNVRALRNHRATPCQAPIWVIQASHENRLHADGTDRFAGWSKLTAGTVTILPTPGSHVSIKSVPHVSGVAKHVDEQITQITDRTDR